MAPCVSTGTRTTPPTRREDDTPLVVSSYSDNVMEKPTDSSNNINHINHTNGCCNESKCSYSFTVDDDCDNDLFANLEEESRRVQANGLTCWLGRLRPMNDDEDDDDDDDDDNQLFVAASPCGTNDADDDDANVREHEKQTPPSSSAAAVAAPSMRAVSDTRPCRARFGWWQRRPGFLPQHQAATTRTRNAQPRLGAAPHYNNNENNNNNEHNFGFGFNNNTINQVQPTKAHSLRNMFGKRQVWANEAQHKSDSFLVGKPPVFGRRGSLNNNSDNDNQHSTRIGKRGLFQGRHGTNRVKTLFFGGGTTTMDSAAANAAAAAAVVDEVPLAVVFESTADDDDDGDDEAAASSSIRRHRVSRDGAVLQRSSSDPSCHDSCSSVVSELTHHEYECRLAI